MTIFRVGIVKGLIGQVIGTALGILLVVVVRLAMGVPAWNAEAAVAAGAILGGICFLIGLGSFADWYKWIRGEEPSFHHGAPPDRPTWMRYLGVDYSHKVIGVQYAVLGIIVLGAAGISAMIFRTELVQPGLQFLSANAYNTSMSLHGIVMIAGILISSAGMSNYLVPLMVGASDMAFPRLNSAAFWVNVPGAIMVLSSIFIGGWDTGWTGYPPLSARDPLGVQTFFIGVYFIGLSSILGALNLIVTTLRHRAPGMTLFRMPIFVWAVLATSLIALTATQLIGLSFLMVLVERLLGMGFFDPAKGGNVILFQHIFWFYSHPAVYIFVLPGLGIISELLPVFARKPLFGYRAVALSSLGIALVGFLVWAHHMFAAGMEEFLRIPFQYTTLLVAVPTGVKFFSWVATLWEGKLWFPTPMLFVLGAIAVFLIGGLSGPPNGLVVTDLYLTDTYWVVGHFHATMFGGFVFPFFAALYYWYPKVTGRMYNEPLGKIHFWTMLPAFWVQSLGQMLIGLMAMRRRIADYDPALNVAGGQIAITIAGFVIALGMLLMIVNFVWSFRRGPVAAANPWRSRSPEWQLPSPVPELSYGQPLQVTGEPYDYGLPGSTYVHVVPGPVGAGE